MIEIQIPQNVQTHEPKVVGRFTARQILFVCIAGVVGFIAWKVAKAAMPNVDTTTIIIIAGFAAFIPLAFGFIKIQDQPLEKMGWVVLKENILAPSVRRKEYRHPALEKWEKDPLKVAGIEEAEKHAPTKKKKDEFHVKRSKKYRGIK